MKPLLSELFLPCSRMHSPIWANRYPLTTITGAQRASGQTHSRARSHQDDADLRAGRSRAYLVSCIRVRSAHGNSLVPLPPRAPELNGQENIWQFMRQNWLSNRIFKSFDDIVDHCCYAWNTLIEQPWKIMSIARRDWAAVSHSI